ncbi:hypothetical protein D3C72_1504510 [compost metagenome]
MDLTEHVGRGPPPQLRVEERVGLAEDAADVGHHEGVGIADPAQATARRAKSGVDVPGSTLLPEARQFQRALGRPLFEGLCDQLTDQRHRLVARLRELVTGQLIIRAEGIVGETDHDPVLVRHRLNGVIGPVPARHVAEGVVMPIAGTDDVLLVGQVHEVGDHLGDLGA